MIIRLSHNDNENNKKRRNVGPAAQDTKGMQQILDERVRRKDKRHPNGRNNTHGGHDANGSLADGGGGGGGGGANKSAGDAVNRGGGGDGGGGGGADNKGDLSALVHKLKGRGLGNAKGAAASSAVASAKRQEGGGLISLKGSAVTGGAANGVESGPDLMGAGKGRRGKKKRRKA